MADKKIIIVMPDALIEALDRSAAAAQRSRSAEVRVLLLAALGGGVVVPRPVAPAALAPVVKGACAAVRR